MIQRTAQAKEELIEIWIYIAQDNLVAGNRAQIVRVIHGARDLPYLF